jgi:hypothetical protein
VRRARREPDGGRPAQPGILLAGGGVQRGLRGRLAAPRGFRPCDLGHRLPLAGPGRRLSESGPRAPAWGVIALFWNEHVRRDASEGFFEAAQEVYEREAPEIVKPDDHKGRPQPHELPDRTAEIEASGLFNVVIRRDYRWDQPYDAEGYLRVLSTYSGHMALDPTSRERLFGGIRDLIERKHGGRIVKGYATTLYLARRK